MRAISLIALLLAAAIQLQSQGKPKVPAVLNFTMNSLDGKPVNLARYQGDVVLMVNVASQCGYTPQYEGLQELHKRYAGKGLRILGFPSNDFGQQEPGSNSEIADFCQKNYGVQFDMFSKIDVLGSGKAPLYQFLTSPRTNPKFAGDVEWNFEKFLVGRDGQVIGRFKSPVEPLSGEMVSAIEAALAIRAAER
jgi:glutathione peroxidase